MNGYQHAAFDIDYSVVDLTNNSTDVTTSATLVRGVYLNSTLTAACVIQDSSTAVFTIPSAAAAGTYIPLGDAFFKTGLTVNPGDSETGSLTILYKQRV